MLRVNLFLWILDCYSFNECYGHFGECIWISLCNMVFKLPMIWEHCFCTNKKKALHLSKEVRLRNHTHSPVNHYVKFFEDSSLKSSNSQSGSPSAVKWLFKIQRRNKIWGKNKSIYDIRNRFYFWAFYKLEVYSWALVASSAK